MTASCSRSGGSQACTTWHSQVLHSPGHSITNHSTSQPAGGSRGAICHRAVNICLHHLSLLHYPLPQIHFFSNSPLYLYKRKWKTDSNYKACPPSCGVKVYPLADQPLLSGNSLFWLLLFSQQPCTSPPLFPKNLPCTPNHTFDWMSNPASSPPNWSCFVTATIPMSESSWSQWSLFLSILHVLSDPLVPVYHLWHPFPYPSTATTLD